jgi:hypothetical protein
MNSGKLDLLLSQVCINQDVPLAPIVLDPEFSCTIKIITLFSLLTRCQGKEYVFIANSDNLGAIVDMSILM